MKNSLFIFFSLLFCTNIVLGQVKISGTVKDAETKSPLPGVTIVLLQNQTEKVLTGSSSDQKGQFELKGKTENAFLRLSFIGYETRQFDNIQVKNGKADLGEILLKTSTLMTSAVEIQGQKPMVEFYIDKQVINMEKVPGSNSGSVSDALRNTGIVEVDPISSKLSVRGNSNVNILIDGKPQPMADNLLSQMPATYVDKVEVITTPSAKDDPEGDAGTINIITRKEKRNNMNGSVSLYSSTQETGFGSAVFNYRSGKLNIFSSANSYFGGLKRFSQIRRENYSSTILNSQLSDAEWVMKGYMAGLKLGFDYDFDTLNSITVTGNYNKTNGKMGTVSNNHNFNINKILTYSYFVDDDGRGDFNNYSVSTNYKRKINMKGHEITGDFFFSDMLNTMINRLSTKYDYMASYPNIQTGDSDVKNKTIIVNSDYVNPAEFGKIEAGYKFTFRDRMNDLLNQNYNYATGLWRDSLGLSNIFKYKENIHALYTAYSNKIFIFDYKIGLRYEKTLTDGRQLITNDNFRTDYSSWFPSFGLSYKFTEMFQAAFNASRRINRPQMDMINPFIKINGPNNITVGNPKLEPTYTNSFELRFNPIVNIYFNDSKGRPSQISTNIDDSVTVNTTINSVKNRNYGFELTIPVINEPRFPVALPDWFRMFTLRISYSKFIEEGGYRSEIYSINRDTWRFLGNFSVKLWEDINLMVYYNINAKNSDQRYVFGATQLYGLMISRDFFDKKLNIALNFQDIFDSMRPVNEVYGSNFYSYTKTETYKSRSVGLSIRYNFNDFSNRKDKEIDDGRDKSGDMFGGQR